jgi:hypothetical protein
VDLDSSTSHGGLPSYLAQSNRMKRRRVDAVLEQVGLTEAAMTRVGMGSRPGLIANESPYIGPPPVLLGN